MSSAAPSILLGHGHREVVYPESDGEPMGETDVHIDELIDARAALKHRFRSRKDAYVAGNLLIYYEEGEPASRFAPDVFVIFGVPKRKRRIYKLWEEKVAPSFVLELTSRGTRLVDKGSKMALCAELGVADYFLFDPEGDYLKPSLQGFHLVRGRYRPITPDAEGRVPSKTLGLLLAEDEGLLRFIDPETGERLLKVDERAARLDEQTARLDEQTARLAEAEAEIRRLKAQLEKPKR